MIEISFTIFIIVIEDLLHSFTIFKKIALLICDLSPLCYYISLDLFIARNY